MIRLSSEKGFTLVELLVALVGFAILAMVAIPKMAHSSDQARIASCKQNQVLITCACTFYYACNYSETRSEKIAAFPNRLSDLTPEYLEEIPLCPDGGQYIYRAIEGTVTCSEPNHRRHQ